MAVECEEQNINIAIGHCCAGPGVTPVNPPPHVREAFLIILFPFQLPFTNFFFHKDECLSLRDTEPPS